MAGCGAKAKMQFQRRWAAFGGRPDREQAVAFRCRLTRTRHRSDSVAVSEVKNYETRKKALRDKGLLLFLTSSALSVTFPHIMRSRMVAIPLTADAAGAIFGDRLTARMRQKETLGLFLLLFQECATRAFV
jgi:hypothetical protein